MPLARLLLLSLAAFLAVAVVLLRDGRLRRRLCRRRVLLGAVLMATLLSGGSYFIAGSGASGTGTRTAHGWPKPFYFAWESWESAERVEGINWIYFAGNVIAWLALTSLVLLAWAAARGTPVSTDT